MARKDSKAEDHCIKLNLDHQTATIDAMFNFVDGLMVHLDGKLRGILENFDGMQKLVRDDLNFTSTVKNTVELETELIEMGFRIQSLLNNLNKQQNIILQILLRKDNNMAWYVQLFEPAILLRTLEEAERNVAQNLEFPKKPNNGLVPEIRRLADVSFVTENNQMLVMDLRLPLVTKRKFQAC